jgi:phospholipid/cholesterol/gamma-HCH transport system ATP-binding protein
MQENEVPADDRPENDRPENDERPDEKKHATDKPPIIRVRDLHVGFGPKMVLEGLDLDVKAGEVMGFVGGSGQGKSVLTRTILGLLQKTSGEIEVFGEDLDKLSPEEHRALERRWGVLFQSGALFSALTVKQNIQAPMREYLSLSQETMDDLAMLKIKLVGLASDAADKFPSELSGGMIKRAALARALSLDPELLFLDEPTSGLDPIGAAEFDDLISTLQKTLGLTVFMVTHDLDSLYSICDTIAALADGRVIASGPLSTVLASDHPWLRSYFHGKRARTIVRSEAEPKNRAAPVSGGSPTGAPAGSSEGTRA